MNTKQLLNNLLKLQSIEFGEDDLDDTHRETKDKKIAELRRQIPVPILNHYDRLGARGKKGAAPVRNQTCTGCHVSVTRAIVLDLMRGEDIQVCENCGRYLYLPEPAAPESPAPRKTKRSRAKVKDLVELPTAA